MSDRVLLITGAGGFLGRHAQLRAAAAGFEPVAAAGDLRVPGTARRTVADASPSAILHLAARPRSQAADPWGLLGEELEILGNLFQARREHAPGVPMLVPGSAGQYGGAGDAALSETTVLDPISGYGAVKCVLETAALSAPLSGEGEVIWARTFNLVGPGQGTDAPVAAWAQQLAAAEAGSGDGVVRTGRLDVVRDYLDVRDAVDAFLALLQCGRGGRVNVASGRGVELRELLDRLLALSSAEVDVVESPGLRRAVDPPRAVADVARLGSLTGWRPRIDLDRSLSDVLDDWRAVSSSASPPAGSRGPA